MAGSGIFYLGSFLSVSGAAGSWVYLTIDYNKTVARPSLSFGNISEMYGFVGGDCVDLLLGKKLTKNQLLDHKKIENGSIVNGFFSKKSGYGAKGCVTVQWTKSRWENNFWRGKAKFEWVFKDGDEAIVARGITSSSSSLLSAFDIDQWDGNFAWNFIFIKNGEIQKIKNEVFSKISKKGIVDAFFPRSFKDDKSFDNYWNFPIDFDKICRKKTINKCSGDPKTSSSFYGKWKWTEGGWGNSFHDWSDNFQEWWQKYSGFSVIPEGFKKVGKWQKF